MADIRVHFKHDTTTVEMGLVTSSCWQTKTRGGSGTQFVNKISCNARGPLRLNLHCTIVSSMQSKPRSVVFKSSCLEAGDFRSTTRVINTPREVYAKPQNLYHSHLCTSCANNFRRTEYFRNTDTDEIHMDDRNHRLA